MFGRRLAAVIRALLIYQRPQVVRQLIQVIRRKTYAGNHALFIVIKGCLIPCWPADVVNIDAAHISGQWPPGFCQDCQFG